MKRLLMGAALAGLMLTTAPATQASEPTPRADECAMEVLVLAQRTSRQTGDTNVMLGGIMFMAQIAGADAFERPEARAFFEDAAAASYTDLQTDVDVCLTEFGG